MGRQPAKNPPAAAAISASAAVDPQRKMPPVSFWHQFKRTLNPFTLEQVCRLNIG
jgi:hypothetical protein